MVGKIFLLLILSSLGAAPAVSSNTPSSKHKSITIPNSCEGLTQQHKLNYEDFRILSNHDHLSSDMLHRLDSTLNSAYCGHATKHTAQLKTDTNLNRKYFRVTQWNIERGFSISDIKLIYKNKSEYLKTRTRELLNEAEESRILEEIELLKDTDVFILNEVDLGMQRTEYKNIAKEITDIIGGSFAFAPEFIELDKFYLNDPQLDRLKLKALHGNAVVSKFPIKAVRYVRLPLCYDWFNQEQDRLTVLEQARRTSSKVVINEEVLTEVRQGSRIALITDIEIPRSGTVSVISVHLENRTIPKCRVEQIDTLLATIKDIKHPVILGGDLNNFEKSAEPTSISKIIKRTVTDPQNLAKATITYFNPYAFITNVASFTVGGMRKYKDPTVGNIPVLLPNRAKELFNHIENFEFTDGNKFDFSGDKNLSYNQLAGELSNSNQRASKGFVETFKFNRSYGVALYKIDWLFVKPLRIAGINPKKKFKDLKDTEKTYIPAFGKTLKDLNFSPTEGPLSDHSPVTCKIII